MIYQSKQAYPFYRTQALAPAGGIWVSEAVYQNVANKTSVATKFVGEKTLKNVKEPVRVYEVSPTNYRAELSESYLLHKDKPQAVAPKSVAVLPFVNMSNDPEQDYFSDGIAEEITSSLAHLRDLKVAGRTSSSQFKGAKVDLREVGEKLGVATVLEGSVRKQGNRLRITAQLISVTDGFHLWTEKYDRNMDDIFAIQDEIALAITKQLKVTLLGSDREKITKTTTKNTQAYELYLKGRFHINRRGSFIVTGLEYFKQAIALDPSYVLAYAGYADALILSAGYNFLRGKEVMKEAKLAAQTALELDDTLGEAYGALAFYYIALEWNWAEAEKNFLKSIELNPKYAQTHSLYGILYLAFVQGRIDEAVKQIHVALELEPLSAINHADMAWTLYVAGRFEEALTMAKTGIELDPNSFLSQRLAGLSYIALNRHEEAVKTLRHLVKMSNRHQQAVNSLIWAYCSAGNFKEARLLMNELEKKAKKEYIAGTFMGLSAAWLGDLETAFKYLEEAFNQHDANLLNIRHAPNVPESLRKDKRFQNLIDRIGFPKTSDK